MADFNVKPLEADLDFDHLPYWDVVIIGAGPAGLAASLTTAHRALTTLVIEAKGTPGGQPHFLYSDKRIVDIPGFPDGITGEELSDRTYRQAVNALVQFRFNEELVAIDDTDEVEAEDRLKRVVTSKTSYLCRKVDRRLRPAALSAATGRARPAELEERPLQDSQDRRLRRPAAWPWSAAAIRRSTPR